MQKRDFGSAVFESPPLACAGKRTGTAATAGSHRHSQSQTSLRPYTMGKTVIVTGVSPGGFDADTARALALYGAKVVLAVRSPS
ncbi:hypothetical protein B0H19DRAFT_693272 [Mycena capillaripes]|nr:hypothetical protein B0H19DRAFT_693272 [Mycena capillaripes]